MYDTMKLSKGNPESPNWEVTLEQNPMPKPDSASSSSSSSRGVGSGGAVPVR